MIELILELQAKMKKKISLILSLVVSIIVTSLFFKYRKAGYYVLPETGIFDERNYVFQGISIRKNGIPLAWSDLNEYGTKQDPPIVKTIELEDFSITIDNKKPNLKNYREFPKPLSIIKGFDFGKGIEGIRLVQPFLDHPPLGGLIYSLAIKKDVMSLEDIKPEDYRKLPIYLAILNSFLIFTLAYIIFRNPWISTLSTIIYNSAPSYFISSRYALLENVVSPLSLTFMILLVTFLETEKKIKKIPTAILIIAGLFAGASVLAKESGISFLIAGIIILIHQRINTKKIAIFTISSLIPIIIYIIWGSWIGEKLFWEIILANSERRFIGSLNFINTSTFQWSKKIRFDGWWIWGFLSTFITASTIKKQKIKNLIIIPITTSLLIILFLAGLSYPWYYFYLIPYLSITSGYTIWLMIKERLAPVILAFFLIPFSSSLYWGYQVMKEYPNKLEYRIFILTISAILLIKSLLPKKTTQFSLIFKLFFIIVIIVALELNRRSIVYFLSNWEKPHVPVIPSVE